jgi:hypothetical protein
MEPEGPEIGPDNLAGTGTVGQPIVQEKEHIEKNEHTEEKKRTEDREDMWEKHHAGPHPGNIPILLPGIDQVWPDATVPLKGTGKKNRTKKKPVTARLATEVHRKTELQGMSTKSFPEEPAQVRRRTEQNLRNSEFGIPYAATEKAVRDLVCSLVERQDRMNAGIILDIHFMQEDIGILQDQVYKLKTVKSSVAAGEKK